MLSYKVLIPFFCAARPHRVLGNLPGPPFLVQILYAWIAKSLFSLIHEEDVGLL